MNLLMVHFNIFELTIKSVKKRMEPKFPSWNQMIRLYMDYCLLFRSDDKVYWILGALSWFSILIVFRSIAIILIRI